MLFVRVYLLLTFGFIFVKKCTINFIFVLVNDLIVSSHNTFIIHFVLKDQSVMDSVEFITIKVCLVVYG